MPRLFTKSDLERVARLVETAGIEEAVARVADDTPDVYTRGNVEQLIRYAAQFGAEAAMKLL